MEKNMGKNHQKENSKTPSIVLEPQQNFHENPLGSATKNNPSGTFVVVVFQTQGAGFSLEGGRLG